MAGCGDVYLYSPVDPTPAPAELSLFGEFVEMGVGDNLEVCGGSFEYANRFVELYLDGSAHEFEGPIEYYYLDLETIQTPEICGPNRGGCARDGVVYAETPVHTHELVHAIRQRQPDARWGLSILEEGLAQRYLPVGFGWVDDFSPEDLPGYLSGRFPTELYDPAAQIVAVVGDAFSIRAAEDFVDATHGIEAPEDVDPVVRSSLGISLAELDGLYGTYPRCSPVARAQMLVDCAQEPLSWDESPGGDPLVIGAIGHFTCDDSRVVGPLDERNWTSFVVDIPTDGIYHLSAQKLTELEQRLQFVSCDAICGDDIDLEWDGGNAADISLPAGRYLARLGRREGDAAAIGFNLRGPI